MIVPPKTDLRQGVTATQHEVLDLIKANSWQWGFDYDLDEQLGVAQRELAEAKQSPSLTIARERAIKAAALIINCADEMAILHSARVRSSTATGSSAPSATSAALRETPSAKADQP